MGEVKRLSAAALAVLLASCAHAPTLPPQARYVAMGSSYAAGTSIESTKPGTPARCGRSPRSYASLVAGKMGLDLIDVSCGGATTAHILGPWAELAPQVEAVTADTRLVTITIGGNDVGYVRNLMAATCQPGSPRCIPVQAVSDDDWLKLHDAMHQIVKQVRARSPKARIVFIDYIRLLPDTGTCKALNMTAEAAARSRQAWGRLADITAEVAQADRVDLIPAGMLSATHTPCDSEPWGVGAPGSTPGVPWHPNAAGHAAIAAALEALLRR